MSKKYRPCIIVAIGSSDKFSMFSYLIDYK